MNPIRHYMNLIESALSGDGRSETILNEDDAVNIVEVTTVNLAGRYLYHATPHENVNKILQMGFVPTKHGVWGDEYTEGRTYFCQDATDCYSVAGQMILEHNVESVVVIKIDASRLDPAPMFYPDPDWMGENDNVEHPAVFTTSSIPSSAIVGVVQEYSREDYD